MPFAPDPSKTLRAILNDEKVRQNVQDFITTRTGHVVSELGGNMETTGRPQYCTIMNHLLDTKQDDGKSLLDVVEKRLQDLGLDGHIKYLDSGEESLVFELGSNFVLRLAPAWNRGFDLPPEDMPSPMLKPVYHELIRKGPMSVRMMILPRLMKRPGVNPPEGASLTEINIMETRENKNMMNILTRAMNELGYERADFTNINHMVIPGDPKLTPICMDYGVFTPASQQAVNGHAVKTRIKLPAERKMGSEPEEGIEVDNYRWLGLQERHFPILEKELDERIRLILNDVAQSEGASEEETYQYTKKHIPAVLLAPNYIVIYDKAVQRSL